MSRTERDKRSVHVSALLVGAALLLSAESRADDLASAAAKERERRKAIHCSSSVITDEDVRKRYSCEELVSPVGSDPTGSSASLATLAASLNRDEDLASELDAEEEREDRVYAWRQQLHSARDEITSSTAEIERRQASVADAVAGLYGSARTERLRLLEKARQDLAVAQARVAAIEEEGRRGGYR